MAPNWELSRRIVRVRARNASLIDLLASPQITIMITRLWLNLTGNATVSKVVQSNKLDLLLNPEKARQQKEDKEKAMEDMRDDGQNIVTYMLCFLSQL